MPNNSLFSIFCWAHKYIISSQFLFDRNILTSSTYFDRRENLIKISVAMATYNGAAFIEKQLDSIISQTLKPVEIVICDDGSTDDTLKIIRKYSKKTNIRLYQNDINLGYIKNFEKTMSLCTSPLIALSDQDDIWHHDKLKILSKEINGNLSVFSDMKLIDENDIIISESFESYQKIWFPEDPEIRHISLLWENYLTGCSCLIKKELFELCRPFPADLPHDHWLALGSSAAGKIKHIDSKLTFYRKHSANTIGAKKIKFSLRAYSNKIFSYFSSANRRTRRNGAKRRLQLIKLITGQFKEISVYISKFKIFNNYLNSLIESKIHFKAFFIYINNHRYFKYRKIRKLFFALSRLIE